MRETRRLTFLAFVLSAPATPAAAAAACALEGYTFVCHKGERELRVIKNTIAPSGRYGVAWQVPTDASVETWDDGSEISDTGSIKNFLVRLGDGVPVARLAGDHFGDHPRYNHREVVATWSPDSRYVAILNQSKWMTDVSEVYLVSDKGAPKPASLMPACKSAAKNEAARRSGKGGDHYTYSLNVRSVGNDGTIVMRCALQVIKEGDYFAMVVRVKVVADGGALKAHVLDARLCKDERGFCGAAIRRSSLSIPSPHCVLHAMGRRVRVRGSNLLGLSTGVAPHARSSAMAYKSRARPSLKFDFSGGSHLVSAAQPPAQWIEICSPISIGPYFVDFVCRERMIIVEIDGATHSTDQELSYDAKRADYLRGQGYRIFCANNGDVYENLSGVLTALLEFATEKDR
jgi:hypothetical protein